MQDECGSGDPGTGHHHPPAGVLVKQRTAVDTSAPFVLTKDLRRKHLRAMLRSRMVEERLRSLYRQGKITGGVYLGIGQEALSAASGLLLRQGDVFAPLIRDQAGRMAFGESILETARTYLGKRTGHMRGRDGNIHRGQVELGQLPMISHLGAMISTASGTMLARRLRGREGSVALASIGDGAMNCGATHEAINAAAVHRLPVVIVVANNGWSYSTPNSESFVCRNLVERAAGYGIPGHACDGTDPRDCLEVLGKAVASARAGEGAQLVVATLLRMSGHGEHDDARYVPKRMRDAFADCIDVGIEQLYREELLTKEELARWRRELQAEIDAAFAQAEAEAEPDPAEELWSAYAGTWPKSERGFGAQPDARPEACTYAGAIRRAMDDALRAQDEVFVYGEDVGGEFGGAFKITKGLAAKHPGRVINAPISEDAIAGIAIGAALEGMRPIIEFQFADFATIAFNQLVNHAGTAFWRSGRACPLVARLPVGGTPGGGPFHSQMAESWLSHHPGMVVVAPATVGDAYAMLRLALRQDDPVIFCEHKWLYERLRDQAFLPREAEAPLGRALVRRRGRDCTVVTWSAMLHESLAAAERLAADEGVEVEVVDLRTLRPLDLETVLASVSRTGRLVVASEDFPFNGIAGELVAQVTQHGFQLLDAPPRRVAARDTPIPFHPALYAAHRPDAALIAQAVREVLAF